MTPMTIDNLDRARFPWPEPLVIEVICDNYEGLLPHDHKLPLAKVQAALLRETFEHDTPYGSRLRTDFLQRCATIGLSGAVIARIDAAVVAELLNLAGQRFRNSIRLREAFCGRLKAALTDATAAMRTAEARAPVRATRSFVRRRPRPALVPA